MERKLLEGIKVICFGQIAVGPQTTKTLSDYGAEAVMIESKSRPRIGGAHKDGIFGVNRGGAFNQYCTGKLSMTLNLTHPKGVEIVKKLTARTDIIVENYAGGVMKRMGLGYEELKKVKPDIIMLSSSVQGQQGPYAMTRGWSTTTTALAGINWIAGWPDREPAMLGVYTDYIAPHYNLVAILAALDYRRRTGKGQYIDMSQCESGILFMAPLTLDYAVNQRIAKRMGNRSTYAAPHAAYRCQGEDRWCAIAVFTDEEWQGFCQVIGNPVWTNDPKFSNLLARKKNEDELDRLVEEWTINHSAEEVMTMMQAAGVPAGLVATGEDLLEHDPQLKHRHLFQELEHPEIGKYHAYGSTFVLSKSPCELRRAPLLGEHNKYVLKNILSLSDEEVTELAAEGVLE